MAICLPKQLAMGAGALFAINIVELEINYICDRILSATLKEKETEMIEMARFVIFLLCIQAGVFSGVIVSEYIGYLCGRKNTLFHENWKTVLN